MEAAPVMILACSGHKSAQGGVGERIPIEFLLTPPSLTHSNPKPKGTLLGTPNREPQEYRMGPFQFSS